MRGVIGAAEFAVRVHDAPDLQQSVGRNVWGRKVCTLIGPNDGTQAVRSIAEVERGTLRMAVEAYDARADNFCTTI